MIIDVAQHVGFGGVPALTAVPLDEFAVTLALDRTLAARVRRCAVEVLSGWSVDAAAIGTAVLAADALARGLRRADDAHAGPPTGTGSVQLHLSSTTDAVRVALTDRAGTDPASTVQSSPVSTMDQALDESLVGAEVRWGISHEADTRTRWFDIAADAAEDDPRLAALYQARSRETLLENTTRAVASAEDLRALAAAATKTLRRDLRALFVGIAVRERDTLRYLGLHPAPADDLSRWHPVPLDRVSPVATACRDGVLLLHPTADSAERDFAQSSARMRAIGAGSMAHVPLFVGETCVGTLGAGWQQERRSAQHRDELLDIAHRIGHAMGRHLDAVAGHGSSVGRAGSAQDLRAGEQPAAVLVSGSVRINLLTRVVAVVNQRHPVRLTGREYDLLVHLVRHTGTVQTRRDLLRDVWGIDFAADTSVVEVTISRLRRRLGIPDLRTVKDVGYVFGDPARGD